MISAEAQRVLEEQIIGGDMKALFREEKIYRRLLKENVLREGIDPSPRPEWLEGVDASCHHTEDGSRYWLLQPHVCEVREEEPPCVDCVAGASLADEPSAEGTSPISTCGNTSPFSAGAKPCCCAAGEGTGEGSPASTRGDSLPFSASVRPCCCRAGEGDGAILYLHGGGFVLPAGEPQWRFAARLACGCGLPVMLPQYPLAPLATYRETYAAVLSAYLQLANEHGAGKVAVVGDSAGGHLAVALSQLCLQQGLPLPKLVVAISPWAGPSSQLPSRQQLQELEDDDPLISLNGLEDIAAIWMPRAAGEPEAFPPCIFEGPFEGYPPLHIYVGSREALLPDSQLIAARARSAGAPCSLTIASGLWHTYPLFPSLPEAQATFEEICTLIRSAA